MDRIGDLKDVCVSFYSDFGVFFLDKDNDCVKFWKKSRKVNRKSQRKSQKVNPKSQKVNPKSQLVKVNGQRSTVNSQSQRGLRMSYLSRLYFKILSWFDFTIAISVGM